MAQCMLCGSHNWIQCKDALPEDSIPVLISDGDQVDRGWRNCGRWRSTFVVTHWMWLPLAPNK